MSDAPAEAAPQVAELLATVERLREREARLAALYATANDLVAIRDVEEILAAIVGRARQLLGTDIAYVGLSDPSTGTIDIRVIDGAVSPSFKDLRMPFGTGLLGLVASSGSPHVTSDYPSDERFRHQPYIDDAVDDEQVRAILGVPMKVKGATIGALLAANRAPRPFPTEEVELLSSFAAHAAIALENARLFSAAEEATGRLEAHSVAMELAARAHDRLTAALVGEPDVAAVAQVLAEDLGSAVRVADADGRERAEVGEVPPDLSLAATGAVVAGSVAAGRSVALPDGTTGSAYVAAAAAGGDLLGTVLVHRATPLEPAERRTLDRAALGVAVLLAFERTIALTDRRAREDLLGEVLSGPADPGHTQTLLRRERVDVDAPHVLVVLDGGDDAALRRLDAWTHAERGLAGTRDGRLVALVPGDDALRTAGRAQALAGAGTTTGAEVVPHLRDGAAAAHDAAAGTVRALVALGRVGEVADPVTLGSARFLLAAADRADVERFVKATIGPLVAWDARRGTGLVETVEHWCAAGSSAAGAARTLHVHGNTVVQRLERVDALLGRGWREPDRLLDVRLALRMWRLGPS